MKHLSPEITIHIKPELASNPGKVLDFILNEGLEGKFLPYRIGDTQIFDYSLQAESEKELLFRYRLLKGDSHADSNRLSPMLEYKKDRFSFAIQGGWRIGGENNSEGEYKDNKVKERAGEEGGEKKIALKPEQGILYFLLPEVGEEMNLQWREEDVAILIEMVSYKPFTSSDKDPVFYVNIRINPGLWGIRHLWIESAVEIVNLITSDKEGDDLLSKLKEDLEREIIYIKKFEKEILDIDKIRKSMWMTIKKIIIKLGNGNDCYHLTPSWLNKKNDRNENPVNKEAQTLSETPLYAGTPLDLEVYIPWGLPEKPPLFCPEEVKLWVWLEFLSWHSPDYLREKCIQFLIKEQEERFFPLLHRAKRSGKDTWNSMVEILTKREETPNVIQELLSWIADPNWPGAGESWEHLVKRVRAKALPEIDTAIEIAHSLSDDWWQENLNMLKEEIMKKQEKEND